MPAQRVKLILDTLETTCMVVDRKTAQQAREMLEKSKRQSELTQMELVKNLNSQLEREADARIAAEKASKELQKQRDILKIAVEDAKSALDELKKRGAEDGLSLIHI